MDTVRSRFLPSRTLRIREVDRVFLRGMVKRVVRDVGIHPNL